MNIKWVQSPCKDCPDRHMKCHGTCEKYLDYKERHWAEKKRMYEEDAIDKAIRGLNYDSAKKKEKVSLPLQHGRKKR